MSGFGIAQFWCPSLELTQITNLGLDEHETDAENRTLRNSAYKFTNPLEKVKKHVKILNRPILLSELGVRPKLRFWA